tara:strand:+ start:2570 stop:3088 length:519 start_codon:yes stop_codon:yes gene_type:complete
MTINNKLSKIQSSLKAKKSKFNSFGKYNYRSAEDILEAVKPYLIEHDVTVIINEGLSEMCGNMIMTSTASISDGENAIHAKALVAVDMAQKGMNAPQKFGSASSYGKKYALGNLFLIDDTADSDATNTHGKGSKPKLEGVSLTKAKEFIKSGGSIDAIKAKYDVSNDILKTL